jgi:hypothetical protein
MARRTTCGDLSRILYTATKGETEYLCWRGEPAAAGGDHRTAFPAYEEAVRGYAEGCVKSAEGVAGWMVPESRFMARLLRQNCRLVLYLPWKGLIARSIRKTAGAITLKSYDE